MGLAMQSHAVVKTKMSCKKDLDNQGNIFLPKTFQFVLTIDSGPRYLHSYLTTHHFSHDM